MSMVSDLFTKQDRYGNTCLIYHEISDMGIYLMVHPLRKKVLVGVNSIDKHISMWAPKPIP